MKLTKGEEEVKTVLRREELDKENSLAVLRIFPLRLR
jgi:hypothetical protein